MTIRFAVAMCLVAALAASSVDAAEKMKVKNSWSGKNGDAVKKILAPSTGFITKPKTWVTLWQSWRPGHKLPAINFDEDIVLVGVVNGPNLVLMQPTIDDKGNVQCLIGGTKIGGPGFGYKLIQISRKGVKTFNSKPIAANGVQGVLVIPKSVAAFAGQTLEIKLWEYDPRLADAPAKLVDEFRNAKYGHKAGKDTKTAFVVGGKLEPRPDRRYYITVFVLNGGKRTHIGEKDGKRGLCKVLTQGNPSAVTMIVRSVR